MNRFVFTLLVLLVITLPAYSVDKKYSFKHINSADGLSASNVKCILRDSRGFMWFGTKNGLNLYDGMDIERLKCFDYVRKHGNDNIGALYEDKTGKIWIGTDRGVFRFDPDDVRFKFMDGEASPSESNIEAKKIGNSNTESPNNYVLRILGDAAGNVWVLIPTQGIFRFKGDKVDFFSNPKTSDNKQHVYTDIAVSPTGEIYAVSNYLDIYVHNSRDDRFRKVFSNDGLLPAPSSLTKMISDQDGDLFFATLDGYIYSYNPHKNGYPQLIDFSKTGKVYLRDIALFDDDLWIGTHNGLRILDLLSGSEKELRENALDPFSLSDNSLSVIYRDYEGHAWIGTMFGGVDFLSNNPFRFDVFGREYGLSSMRIRGLDVSDDGKLWIGTENNGLNLLDLNTGSVSHPVVSPAKSSGVMHFVDVIGNDVYLGFTHSSVLKVRGGIGKTEILPIDSVAGNDRSGYCYLLDSSGNEWLGLGGALAKRKKGETGFLKVEDTGSNWIFALFEDSHRNIWIGTMGNGLWKYTPSSGKFRNYSYDDGEIKPTGLRSNSISSIMQDSKGNVWVSTDRGGLSKYNEAKDDFITFGIEEGLPDDVVYNVLEDSNGFLWFGTNKGLVKFNPDNSFIKVFSINDGLPFNEFSYNSAAADKSGIFYFGGNNGIIAFNPLLDVPGKQHHPVYFTNVSLLDLAEGSDAEGLEGVTLGKSITLPSTCASFRVTVSSPEYGVSGQRFFYYRLLPVGQEWTRIDGNKITFANLASGDYRLEVRYGDGEDVPVSELRIRILPPWWRSTWAILAYLIIALMAVVLLVIWLQLRNKKKINQREQAYAAEKERELYRDKVEFFTTIAHEIRTPLSLIDIPLEAIEENGIDDPKTSDYLKVMRQNTWRLLHLSRELLDFGKLDSHMLITKKEFFDMSALVSETAERFGPAMDLNGKDLEVDVSNEKLMVFSDKEAVTKILSNLFNNALKYASKNIRVVLKESEGIVAVSVSSDGTKITEKERNLIFEPFYQSEGNAEKKNGVGIGLPLARQLAAVLGGNLVLDNDDSLLNTFTFTFPVGNAEKEDISVADADKDNYVLDEESNQTKLRSSGYHVLVVEDNESIRHLLRDQLSKNFIIDTASNGVVALDKLKKSRVDLVVTNIMMPEMDGMELCRRVKEDPDLSSIPIVFITAKNDLDSKVRGLQMGAEAYIDKPFSIKYLTQTVKSLLENRRRERESFSKKPFFNVDSIQTNKADEEFVKKCMDAITEHLQEEDFNVESLCDILAMSRSNLLRKIKAIFNMSPSELIRLVKLKKSAELIQDGRYRIGEICEMIGISSPSYFSKLFFKQFDITPKAFEKQCQEKRRDLAQNNVEG